MTWTIFGNIEQVWPTEIMIQIIFHLIILRKTGQIGCLHWKQVFNLIGEDFMEISWYPCSSYVHGVCDFKEEPMEWVTLLKEIFFEDWNYNLILSCGKMYFSFLKVFIFLNLKTDLWEVISKLVNLQHAKIQSTNRKCAGNAGAYLVWKPIGIVYTNTNCFKDCFMCTWRYTNQFIDLIVLHNKMHF